MARDPEKAKERKRRYRQRKKIAQFGYDPGDLRGRHGNHATADRHPRWNGGRATASHGYIRIQVGKGHHLADPNGYAYEHRVVAERMIGRRLEPWEEVHHLNHVRSDNRPENLLVLSGTDHAALHNAIRERDGEGRFASPLVPAAAEEG